MNTEESTANAEENLHFLLYVKKGLPPISKHFPPHVSKVSKKVFRNRG